ncbi:MAG: flippase-like domain-containing protein [Chloroflexi bacterium]|nr:flippase-like domain-containing protein [Chloroflexota bacterium]
MGRLLALLVARRGLRRVSPRAVRWMGVLLSLLALVALAALLGSAGDLAGRSSWRELVEPLVGASIGWLALAVALVLVVEVVKTVRWQLLLGVGFATLPSLLSVVLTSRLLNALAPLRAGDVWRVASAARAEGRPLLAAGSSVIVEKALDAAVLGGLSLALLWPSGVQAPLALALAAGLGLALVLGPRLGKPARLPRWLDGVRHLRDGRVLAGAATLTLASLGLGLLANLAVLRALGLAVELAPGLVMLVAAYAAGLVPGAPGRLGVFELAVAAPLAAAGLSPGASVAAALALHVVLLASLALGGLLALPLGLRGQSRRRLTTNGQPAEVIGR